MELSNACLDLAANSFHVPLVDRYSPLAFSIINEVHWHHADAWDSRGDTVFRYALQIVYVVEGRGLVNTIRSDCVRRRYLKTGYQEVDMGHKSDDDFCLARPFYIPPTWLDHFNSNINKS